MDTAEQMESQPKKTGTGTVVITIDMPTGLLLNLDARCSDLGEKRSPTIRQAIREFLQRAAEREARG